MGISLKKPLFVTLAQRGLISIAVPGTKRALDFILLNGVYFNQKGRRNILNDRMFEGGYHGYSIVGDREAYILKVVLPCTLYDEF